VAIVGGGFTGLSLALHLSEAGVAAHVFESEEIGFGGSGRNVGLVNPGIWLPPDDVRKLLGKTRGQKFLDLFGQAPEYVFNLIERFQIRAEATKAGTIHAAHAPAGMRELRGRYATWKAMGAPVELLSREEITAKTGTESFFGGLLDNRAGTINPMGYARGLARASRAAGASISTGTRVTSLSKDGPYWRLNLDRGETALANRVILATNAYSNEIWPGLSDIITPIHYFQISTEPLGEKSKDVLPEGHGLWDTAKVMFSLRRDIFGRIILGSMGKVIGGERGLTRIWAQRTLKRLYPNLENVIWEPPWHGKIGMTPDHLPRIFNPAHNLYALLGYNGRGITTGTVLGQALANYLVSGNQSDLPLVLSQKEQDKLRLLKATLFETAFKAYRVYKTI
jgi:glycine/D-amino acid oxidase-like deaminating enzyme